MKWTNTEGRIPIKSWCENVDDGSMAEAKNLSNHPAAFHHVALMPDCHIGYGMPIGGVVALRNAISPNLVGVDIGCGMIAAKTTLTEIDKESIGTVLHQASRDIPVGFNHHKKDVEWDGFGSAPDLPIIQQELKSARKQLGTLGGGNHFIEIQLGGDGHIWIMLHSGSRNIGYKIAKYYNREAIDLCDRWYSDIPPAKGDDSIAFFPTDTKEGLEYIEAMEFALKFAMENRQRMMDKVLAEFYGATGGELVKTINIHHNFASQEQHFGRNVWVHRKGATRARDGQLGIIPGSMGTPSYIVQGRGNPESFESCSHGAGRIAGRAEFCQTHTIKECDESMEGIVFKGWGKTRKGETDISEAPAAYKDIDEVLDAQTDLVDVVVKLKPLGVMKG